MTLSLQHNKTQLTSVESASFDINQPGLATHLSQLGVHTRSNLDTRVDRKEERTERTAQRNIPSIYIYIIECVYIYYLCMYVFR